MTVQPNRKIHNTNCNHHPQQQNKLKQTHVHLHPNNHSLLAKHKTFNLTITTLQHKHNKFNNKNLHQD